MSSSMVLPGSRSFTGWSRRRRRPEGSERVRPTWAGLVPAAALLLATAALPGSVSAQQPDSTARPTAPAPEPPSTGGWRSYTVAPHPWSTVVAITVALPVGSADDPEGRGGTAKLLGEAVAAAVSRQLPGPSRVSAEVHRGHTLVTVLVVPWRWAEAYRALDAALFRGPVDPAVIDAVRADLLAEFAFEAGTPVQAFQLEAHRLMSSPESPWSRPPRGTPATVETLDPPELEAFRNRRYRRAEAVLSLTGDLDTDDAVRIVTGEAPPAPSTQDGGPDLHVAAGPPPPPATRAWETPDRLQVEPEVTSTWIGVAWPVSPETGRTEVEFLAHQLLSTLDRDPPDPGLFSVDVTVEMLRTSPVVYVAAAVIPDVATEWEARILAAARTLADRPEEPAFFQWQRRRFRNARLLAETAPEQEGARLALDLLRTGAIRDLPAEIWQLEPSSLVAAARGLGPPRIVVYGPDLFDTDGG